MERNTEKAPMQISSYANSKNRKSLKIKIAKIIYRISHASPGQTALLVFCAMSIAATALLYLPIASRERNPTALHDAFFTAISAISVTGLTTVSTAEHWSIFGQVIILCSIQIGGLGIITLASFFGLTMSRKFGLRNKLLAANATNANTLSEVGSLLKIIIITSITIEAILAIVLAPRFFASGESLSQSIYHGIFYSISSFNNAGFTPHQDGLLPYRNDHLILGSLAVGTFIGSLGFPVLLVLVRSKLQIKNWNLHAKLTILTSIILFLGGSIILGIIEWNNPETLGELNFIDRVTQATFSGIMPRSGGFSIIPIEEMRQGSLLITNMLMFIGGGSASTAGGIKVTTIAILFLAALAEIKGHKDVQIFKRRIPVSTLRIAISVTMLSATIISIVCVILLTLTDFTLDSVLFETISAFGTAGLSIGVSEAVPPAGTYLLAITMFIGRVGTITLAAALTSHEKEQNYRYPEERPIIG